MKTIYLAAAMRPLCPCLPRLPQGCREHRLHVPMICHSSDERAQTRPRTADKPRLFPRLGFSFSKAAELAAARQRLADNSPQRQESFMNDSQRIK